MWSIIIILILVGLLMLLLEILVIPGAGVAGIAGFILMGVGIWMAYTREGTTEGHITLVVTLGVNVIGLILALRSKTWKNAMLKKSIKGQVNLIDHDKINVGDKGITISRCAPMGKASFGDVFYEVSALSEFIDQEKEVEVLKISGNKIYIKQIND